MLLSLTQKTEAGGSELVPPATMKGGLLMGEKGTTSIADVTHSYLELEVPIFSQLNAMGVELH